MISTRCCDESLKSTPETNTVCLLADWDFNKNLREKIRLLVPLFKLRITKYSK